jgi:AraC-like DNA-binding protein
MSRGRAKLAMAQGVSVWVLEAPDGFGDADFHAHHAIQITAALDGELSLTAGSETVSGELLAVAADARHLFKARGLLAFVFVEPESPAGRALTRDVLAGRDLVALDSPSVAGALAPLQATFTDSLDRAALAEAGHAAVAGLTASTPAPPADPRILRVIDHIAAHLDAPLPLADAASLACLSPSRFRHLFVEQTGLALKTYLLWQRLVRAVDIYSDGASLTEAAHAAGFADSAHYSRVFRRTFGLPATTLTRI